MAETSTKIVNPFTDLAQAIPTVPQQSISASEYLYGVKEMQVGTGSNVFRSDKQGIWLGAEKFANAPFKVDMFGNVTAANITLSGYIPTGGAAGDVNSGAGTINANRINASTLSAISANLGSITAGTITGVTITGSLLRTAASGQRIVVSQSTNDITIYSASALVGTIYGSSSSLWLQSNVADANVTFANQATVLGTIGKSGSIYAMALSPSNSRFLVPSSGGFGWLTRNITFTSPASSTVAVNGHFEPFDDATYRLGDAGARWNEIYAVDIYADYISTEKHVIVGQFLRLANMTGSAASSLTPQNGSMYYRTDDGVIRVYLNGAWRTITTS
jgi:hypothetical protein